MRQTREARRSDEGASAVEYSLIVVAIAAVIVAVAVGFGLVTNSSYQQSCEAIETKVTVDEPAC